MGHKIVCLECREAFNLNHYDRTPLKCPKCSNAMIRLNQRFRPPKKMNLKQWKVVKFLINNGFPFQHVYQGDKSEYYKTSSDNYTPYPKTIKEAEEFIKLYADKAILKK